MTPTFTAPTTTATAPAPAPDTAVVTWQDTHYGHVRDTTVSLRNARARGQAATPAAERDACARIVALACLPGRLADLHRVNVTGIRALA